MRKNKILILITMLFLLSGCTFEYNLELTEDNIKENNIIYIENSNKNNIKNKVESIVNKYTGPTNSLGMYKSEIVENNNNFGMSYQKEYDLLDYNYSISFSACYDKYKIIRENDKVIISAGNSFTCFDKYEELEKVTINLITDFEVIAANCDNKNDNKYTWYIDKENAKDKEINIVLNTANVNTKRNKEVGVFAIVTISLILIGVIILLISIRGKRKNKI